MLLLLQTGSPDNLLLQAGDNFLLQQSLTYETLGLIQQWIPAEVMRY